MIFWQALTAWYEKEAPVFQGLPFVQAAFTGRLTRQGYIRFLQQYYHYVGTAGPVYSACSAKLGRQFTRVREWFVRSAFKETGHDEFIVADLEALGIPATQTRESHPSPEMDALCAYNFAFIERHHPVGLLGMAFLMGRVSTAYSLKAADRLKSSLGLTDEAVTFFFSHGHLDKDQPEDVSLVIQSITEPEIQQDIFLNARTVFMLYQNFFRSLTP